MLVWAALFVIWSEEVERLLLEASVEGKRQVLELEGEKLRAELFFRAAPCQALSSPRKKIARFPTKVVCTEQSGRPCVLSFAKRLRTGAAAGGGELSHAGRNGVKLAEPRT